MAVITETVDQSATSVVLVPETVPEKDVNNLIESFSKLNPLAKEFVPSKRFQLSADAPIYEFRNHHRRTALRSTARDGTFHPPRYSFNRGRRNFYDQNRAKIRRTIYISGVPEYVNEGALAGLFRGCGTVRECRVCGDTKSSLQFGFIEFAHESQARAALSLSGVPMIGNPPEVSFKILPSKTAILPVNIRFLPRSSGEREMTFRTIYCTNIDSKVNYADVRNFFEQLCGPVTCLRLLVDVRHATSIAFVEFAQLECAKLALRHSGAVLGELRVRISPSKTPVWPWPNFDNGIFAGAQEGPQ